MLQIYSELGCGIQCEELWRGLVLCSYKDAMRRMTQATLYWLVFFWRINPVIYLVVVLGYLSTSQLPGAILSSLHTDVRKCLVMKIHVLGACEYCWGAGTVRWLRSIKKPLPSWEPLGSSRSRAEGFVLQRHVAEVWGGGQFLAQWV